MNRALLMAILDTLLPGDAAGAMPLPSGSDAGIDPASLDASAQPILGKIEADRFEAASAAERAAMLRDVEQAAPEGFRVFLARALAGYYQAPRVLAAFGWRSEPPQPLGHSVPAGDAATQQLLENVRRRGKLWRG